MSLADDVYAAPVRGCKLYKLSLEMSEEDRKALEYAIAKVRDDSSTPQESRLYTIRWLVNVLVDNGHSVGKTVVSEHVRGDCACEHRE